MLPADRQHIESLEYSDNFSFEGHRAADSRKSADIKPFAVVRLVVPVVLGLTCLGPTIKSPLWLS